jgi:hypothetical protein
MGDRKMIRLGAAPPGVLGTESAARQGSSELKHAECVDSEAVRY